MVKGILENKYKYTYNDEMIEDEVTNTTNHNAVQITDCFTVIDNTIFNKIRTGRKRQRTPTNSTTEENSKQESSLLMRKKDEITILQHNVQSWDTTKFSSQIYIK